MVPPSDRTKDRVGNSKRTHVPGSEKPREHKPGQPLYSDRYFPFPFTGLKVILMQRGHHHHHHHHHDTPITGLGISEKHQRIERAVPAVRMKERSAPHANVSPRALVVDCTLITATTPVRPLYMSYKHQVVASPHRDALIPPVTYCKHMFLLS